MWNSKHVIQAGCKWIIGTGESINVWEQNWLKEGLALPITTERKLFASITKVQDLMLNNAKAWDYKKI
jgi:hypothetical protein